MAAEFVYSVKAGPFNPSAPGVQLFLESNDDADQICHKECLSQQAAQHADRVEHRFFAAFAYIHDDAVARVRS